MDKLTDAQQTRVLDLYQAARETRERALAIIHVIQVTGLPEAPVRAVIADFIHDCGEDAA